MNNRLLNINIQDHPTNRNKTVYFYTSTEHSNYFKELLSQNKVSFEYQLDEEGNTHYFGISKVDSKIARKLNFLVFAKYRKPFISSLFGKYLLLGLTLLCIILALIGYLKK